ncbi:MAG: hypothetical protein AB7I48_20560 [Planctomycetaceae bacterium]
MSANRLTRLFGLIAVGILSVSADAAEWGHVTGTVVLTGPVPMPALLVAQGDPAVKDAVCRGQDVRDDSLRVDAESRGIANVFVFLNRAPALIHSDLQSPAASELVFDQKGCRFLPHAMVVHTGQTVLVKSDDPTNHNTHTNPFFNTPENFLVQANNRAGVPLTFQQREPVPVKVTCDIHPWMTAYWLVVDHPYAALTGERGEFTIENLPVGAHKLRVWHERAGWIDRALSIDIKAGETVTQPPIEVPLERLTATKE